MGLGEQLPVQNEQAAQASPEAAAWVWGVLRCSGVLGSWEEVPRCNRRLHGALNLLHVIRSFLLPGLLCAHL